MVNKPSIARAAATSATPQHMWFAIRPERLERSTPGLCVDQS